MDILRLAALALLCWTFLVVTEARAPGADLTEDDGEAAGRRDQGAEAAEKPAPLDPLFLVIDAARLQRALDEALNLDAGKVSDRPKAPEIGEPLFFDNVRPLGDLKYANELNYLYNSSTRTAPGLQVIEYEYVFADWNAAELDLSYFDGNLELLTPFYQRTLGVGPRRNWVHGLQISPDIYLRSRFVGGSYVYMFGWKPEEDSRFSTLFFVGANRALIGGFAPPGMLARGGGVGAPAPSALGDDRTFGAWRPTFNANFFYKVSEQFTLGIENDLFIHPGKAGEYLIFPFLTYEAGKHAFVQVGGGYYRYEAKDQATFFCHLNLVNPSSRANAEEDRPKAPELGEGRPRRWLASLFGPR